MSRSYKKRPAASTVVYNGSKRRANRRVRHLLKNHDTILDNASFKKAYCSWEIRDYKEVAPSFETFYKDMLNRWHMRRREETPPTRKECLKLYRQWYVRKRDKFICLNVIFAQNRPQIINVIGLRCRGIEKVIVQKL